ncbi:lysophosphatidic acid receptor 6-like isoform X1 [Gigantopelta aegis]|uniref:lysophosphatidic acid receptor 6-like isoform X1 n=1 Tax=Gigantopelta aegis TaxID=1735272 RepID=UPI001B88D6AA|nr:lysophosphatidic acid receptor 6-like isoform X1 [Gigantopelta aegis]
MNATDTERLTETTRWLWKICGPLIFIPRLIGNFIAMWIFIKLKITSSKAFLHLFILAVTDTSVLFTNLGRVWIKYTFDLDVRNLSDTGCKIHEFFAYTFMDFSGWILVSLSIERFISVYFPFNFRQWRTIKIAILKLVFLFLLMCAINAHILWTYGLDINTNKCIIINEALRRYDKHIFIWIDMCVSSCIPFVIMFTCSVLIIHRLKNSGMVQHRYNPNTPVDRNTNNTRLLVVLAIVYICLSLPNSIAYPVDALSGRTCSYCDAKWELAWTVTYLILFCNYAINPIIYTMQISKFNNEFRKLLCCQLIRNTHRLESPREHSAVMSTAPSYRRRDLDLSSSDTLSTSENGREPSR